MNRILFLFLSLSFFGISCTQSDFLTEGHYYHLKNKGANLPIWVKGNLESDVFLITIHGGPGASGHEFPLSLGFEYLEEEYAIVYWDQRFASLSQGDPDRSTLSPDQFIEDTHKVVEFIRSQYNNPKLFLLGHSWGGQLAAGYLGRDNHANLFEGWIDLDGSIYGDLEAQIMKDWILAQVPEKLKEQGVDLEYWQYIIDWYEANPSPPNYSAFEPYEYANALDGYAYDWAKTQAEQPIPYKELIFSSMFSFSFYIGGIGIEQTWVDTLNFTPELHEIEIPSLLLWGKQDGAVPAAVGDYVYAHLATDSTHKYLVKIDECSHSPHYDQPERFFQEVSEFMERYR